MIRDSVHEMWRAFLATLGETPETTSRPLSSWYFCDNRADADACADLVVRGIKRATSPALWWFELTGTPLPRPGDLHVVTDWEGEARCVIRTTGVEILPFDEVTARHAAEEGEGDGSLEYWRRVHREYFARELQGTRYTPTEDMPIVFESFTVVYPPAAADRSDETDEARPAL